MQKTIEYTNIKTYELENKKSKTTGRDLEIIWETLKTINTTSCRVGKTAN